MMPVQWMVALHAGIPIRGAHVTKNTLTRLIYKPSWLSLQLQLAVLDSSKVHPSLCFCVKFQLTKLVSKWLLTTSLFNTI